MLATSRAIAITGKESLRPVPPAWLQARCNTALRLRDAAAAVSAIMPPEKRLLESRRTERRDEPTPSIPAMKTAAGRPCQQAVRRMIASESVKVIFSRVNLEP